MSNENNFLIEGSKSYFEAYSAITQFESQIKHKCRVVLQYYLKEYIDALKVKTLLGIGNIKLNAEPSKTTDGGWRGIGVTVRMNGISTAIKWWGVYCHVGWEYDDGVTKPYCYVGDYIRPDSIAEKIKKHFRNNGINDFTDHGKDFGFCENIKHEDIVNCETTLNKLAKQWVDAWKSTGGILKFVK